MLKPIALLVCLSLPFAARADTPVDFSGQWIAADKDDTGGDKPSNGAHPNDGGGGGGRGMGGGHGHGGMGGMGGGRHGHASNGDGAASTALLPDGSDPRLHAHGLIIRQSETVFDIDASGKRSVYRFDNRNNYGAQYGGTVTLKWVAPEMTIETHPDNGGVVVEHYTLADDGQRMTLAIHTETTGGSSQDVRRVFKRGDGTAASASTLP